MTSSYLVKKREKKVVFATSPRLLANGLLVALEKGYDTLIFSM
jgi:hypothetical protein